MPHSPNESHDIIVIDNVNHVRRSPLTRSLQPAKLREYTLHSQLLFSPFTEKLLSMRQNQRGMNVPADPEAITEGEAYQESSSFMCLLPGIILLFGIREDGIIQGMPDTC